MNTETPAAEQRGRRVMLALIALATDLPVPKNIDLYASGILCMTFDRLADGLAWAVHLGGMPRTYTHNGRRYLNEGVICWHGWQSRSSPPNPSRPPLRWRPTPPPH